jgi:hypothetical protein
MNSWKSTLEELQESWGQVVVESPLFSMPLGRWRNLLLPSSLHLAPFFSSFPTQITSVFLSSSFSGQVSSNLEGFSTIFYGDKPLLFHDVGYVMQDVGPGLYKTDSPIEILRFHRDIRCKSVTNDDIYSLVN